VEEIRIFNFYLLYFLIMNVRSKKQKSVENTELNYDTKTLLTVLLLVLVYPVGLVLMLMWMKWPGWLKFLIGLPVFLIVVIFGLGLLFGLNNKMSVFDNNKPFSKTCLDSCKMAKDVEDCIDNCKYFNSPDRDKLIIKP